MKDELTNAKKAYEDGLAQAAWNAASRERELLAEVASATSTSAAQVRDVMRARAELADSLKDMACQLQRSRAQYAQLRTLGGVRTRARRS